MSDTLTIAGLVANSIGSMTLVICSTATLNLRPDGSVVMGGLPELSREQNVARNKRRYWMQRIGLPIGWALMLAGFVMQLVVALR